MFEITIPDLNVLKDLFFAIQVPLAWLFMLIVLDFLLAIWLKGKEGSLDWTKAGDFILKGVTKALALILIAVVGVSMGVAPIFSEGVFYATYAVLMLGEASSIFGHLLDLDIMPEVLKPILEFLKISATSERK